MGEIEVPADRYRGVQTGRSLRHLFIGDDRMPVEIYRPSGCATCPSCPGS